VFKDLSVLLKTNEEILKLLYENLNSKHENSINFEEKKKVL